MIDKEYRGKVFVQMAPRLRWTRGPKHVTVESFRPIDDLTGAVVGDPPLIKFEDGDDVDVARWIGQGRIALASDQTATPSAPLTDTEAHAKQAKADAPAAGG